MRSSRTVATMFGLLALALAITLAIPLVGPSHLRAQDADANANANANGNANGNGNGNGNAQGAGVTPTLDRPMGVVADATRTEIRVAWTLGRETTVPVRAHYVYYWPTDESFLRARRDLINDATTFRHTIDKLRPGTTYWVTVRALTDTPIGDDSVELDPSEDGGTDMFMSRFAAAIKVMTRPEVEIVFEGGTLVRGLFLVRLFTPDEDDPNGGAWTEGRFVVEIGEVVGGIVPVPGRAGTLNLTTRFTLESIERVALPDGDAVPTELLGPDGTPLLGHDGQPLEVPVAPSARRNRLAATLIDGDGARLHLVDEK